MSRWVRSLAVAAAVSLVGGAVASADVATGTFSIAAYDSLTGEVGVAVQSRVYGVGPRVAWAMRKILSWT